MKNSSISQVLKCWLVILLAAAESIMATPRLVDLRRSTTETRLRVEAPEGGRFTLQVSPNLTNWVSLYGLELASGKAEFTDPRQGQFKSLFYRAISASEEDLANPLAVQVQVDSNRTAVATISPFGGMLVVTNASGTAIELMLPEGALISDTTIRITALKQVANAPLSGGLLAGVQLEPEGLELKVPAELKFRLGSAPALGQLVAFGYRGMGEAFHLVSDETQGNTATLRISHFSGAGLGLASDQDLSNLNLRRPQNALDRFEAQLAFLRIQIRRQGGIPTSGQLNAIEGLHRQIFSSVLEPGLRNANTHPEFYDETSGAFNLWTMRVDQAGLRTNLHAQVGAGTGMLSAARFAAMEARSGWRRLDVNRDGRANADDGKKIFSQGIWKPSIDVNLDGKLDMQDFWAWVMVMARFDRTADRAVSPDDFKPATPLVLPQVDAASRKQLVDAAVSQPPATMPVGFEARLLAKLTNVTSYTKSQMLIQGGIAALMQHNLEVARWSFARACQLDPTNYPAFANLAFTFSAGGQFQEALRLNAETLAMNPGCATAWNNLGMLYSRNGQFSEAIACFDQASQNAPFVSQYPLNKAATLLQAGADAAAKAALGVAIGLNRGDSEAQIFNLAMTPPNPGNLAVLEAEYEQYRQELSKDPANQLPPPWRQLEFRDKATAVLQLPAYKLEKKLEEDLQKLTDATMQQITKAFEDIRPKWVSATADMTAFLKNFPKTANNLVLLDEQAQAQANFLARENARAIAGAQVSMDQVLLQLALSQAQIDMLLYADPNEGRRVFELVVDQLYEEPMRDAAQRLRMPNATASVSFPDDYNGMLQWSSGLGFVGIVTAGVADPQGYGKGFTGPATQISAVTITKGEPTVGFSIPGGFVQSEYNFNTGEAKLQVGEGIIMAGTWSPQNGYGFQVGLGFDFELLGPFGASAGTFLKFGSDGSISMSTESGVGVSTGPVGAKVQSSVEKVIVAADHKPLMSVLDLLP